MRNYLLVQIFSFWGSPPLDPYDVPLDPYDAPKQVTKSGLTKIDATVKFLVQNYDVCKISASSYHFIGNGKF